MTGRDLIDGGGFAALEQALERYGSDRTRWPAPVRRSLAAVLASDADAKRRLAEAEALDRLLDMMPEPEIDTRALSDRILAAAESEVPVAARPSRRVAWARSTGNPRASDTSWPAAAMLAASLVLGAFMGLSGTFDTALQQVAVAELSDDGDRETDPGELALDSGALGLFEEDLL